VAETAMPFDGVFYNEADWAKMARLWLTTGVVSGELNSLAAYADSTGMQVKVPTGRAWIEGFYYENDAIKTLAISAADPSNPRIDRVVVRLDRTANTITAAVKTGTPAATPSAPALTQTSATWEIALAQVRVNAGVASIAAGDVTDERTGSVGGGVSVVDAKGDLIVGTADNTTARLPVGANGTIPVADSSSSTGIAWRLPSSAIVATSESTTSTSYTDLTTVGPAVTVTTGTAAIVILTAQIWNTEVNRAAYMGYTVSGASTVAADDARALIHTSATASASVRASQIFFHTGLTAGSNTFTAQYKKEGGSGSANFRDRQILVIPL
jgi:hypothetical protein